MGAHENSDSAYGTFDQGGNVWEWNEAILDGSSRGVRGGAFFSYAYSLEAAYRYYSNPAGQDDDVGFRVAAVPEPATLTLLALGGLVLMRRRRE